MIALSLISRLAGSLAVIFFALTGCQSAGMSADGAPTRESSALLAPAWYAQQSIQANGFTLGYGAAHRLEEAKAKARADLAKQLSAQIQATTQQQTTVVNGTVSSQASSQLKEISQAQLSDLKVVKSEQLAGQYFVVLGMDFRPLADKVIAQFPNLQATAQTDLMAQSPLWQSLQQRLGFVPDLTLTANGQEYTLQSQGNLLKVAATDIPQLYPLMTSSAIHFKLLAQQRPLKPEQLYQVEFQTQTKGYLTYLQVFQTGDTAVFFANQPLASGQSWRYPDPTHYDGLTAELAQGQTQSQDLHVAILCPQKQAFDQLETIGTHSNQTYAKNLQKLPGLVKTCQVSSQIIEIRK